MITDEEAIKFVAEMGPISKNVIDGYYKWRTLHYGASLTIIGLQKMKVLGSAIALFEKSFGGIVSVKAVSSCMSYFNTGDAQYITNVDNLHILGIMGDSQLSHVETPSYSVELY